MSSRDNSHIVGPPQRDPRHGILARRAKFVAAAMTGMGILGCASKSEACLSIAAEDTGSTGDASKDTTVNDAADTEPMPCLSAPLDTSTDSTMDTSTTDTGVDTGPMPCLVPPPSDSG